MNEARVVRLPGEYVEFVPVDRIRRLLGHKNRDMTEHYVRERVGQRVKPLR